MLSLPPAPSPARPRTLLVGTALVSAAGLMLFGGMLAVYLALREAAGGSSADWLPRGVEIPDVAVNVMIVTMIASCVLAQWAVYAITRNNRRDTAIALGLVVLFGLAVLNAQVYVDNTMGMDIQTEGYATLVYAITGTVESATGSTRASTCV